MKKRAATLLERFQLVYDVMRLRFCRQPSPVVCRNPRGAVSSPAYRLMARVRFESRHKTVGTALAMTAVLAGSPVLAGESLRPGTGTRSGMAYASAESAWGGEDAIGNNGDRVPWWKGGMWRNKKRDDGQPSYGNTTEAREVGASGGGSQSRGYDDDMWDDDEDFDGYGDDGSYERFASRATSSGGGRGYERFDDPDDDDPYRTPSFGGGDDDEGWGMTGGRTGGGAAAMNTSSRGGMVGGGNAGGRDSYEGDFSGSLPIPPGMGRGGDDDDFDDPFGGPDAAFGNGGAGAGFSGGGFGFSGGGAGGGGGGGYAGDSGIGGGAYSGPVSSTATVTSSPEMGGMYGDTYSSGSTYSSSPSYGSTYDSGGYSGGGYVDTSMYDSGYIDTSGYAQTANVVESVVQSPDSGTASFLSGSGLDTINYTLPSIESLAPGYSSGYTSDYSSGAGYSGGSYDSGYGVSSPYDVGGYDSGIAPSASFDPYSSGPSFDPYASGPSTGPGAPGAGPGPESFQGMPSVDARGSPQFENAVRLVKENRFSEAKNILASETSRNPSNAAAWRWLADCYYNLLELDEAINAYKNALERDPNDYYALRGQGFAYLHRGHEYWRRMQEEVTRGEKDAAATTFAHAHDNYKKSLELLGLCLRRAPNDGEAVYGEAMAAEGASRKLYSNAISYLKLGPEHRERAELFAENCLTVINKGVERAKERARQNPGDAGPRALLGGLYLRKAILYNQLGKRDLALIELRNSRDVQQSILDEIDKNNATARKNIREAEIYWERWGGNRQ